MRREHEIDDEEPSIKDHILHFFVGDMIGQGAYRRVYKLGRDDQVLKIEYCGKQFCNMVEWQVWNAVEHTDLAGWFAPCIDIDPMGIALIQQRTKPIDSEDEFRKLVETTRGGVLPSFFDDIHYANFGTIDGLLVCHDYGFNHFLDEAVKMKWESVVHPDVRIATANNTDGEGQFVLRL